jgi:hypothetical protein
VAQVAVLYTFRIAFSQSANDVIVLIDRKLKVIHNGTGVQTPVPHH